MVGKGLGWSCLVLTLFLPLRNDVLNNRHSVGLGRASVNTFIDGPEAIGVVLQQSPWGVGFPYSSYRGWAGLEGSSRMGTAEGDAGDSRSREQGQGHVDPKRAAVWGIVGLLPSSCPAFFSACLLASCLEGRGPWLPGM